MSESKNVSTDINESKKPVALGKKVISKFVFLIPIMLLLIGAAMYFITVPEKCGNVISLNDLLFTDPQKVIDTLCAPNVGSSKANSFIGLQVFWRIWLVGLIVSLFFVGKRLQAKTAPIAVNAILTNKEPYLMIQDVTDALEQLKIRKSSKQLDSLIYEVKKLEEKLSIESEFGYGKCAVINCENDIAQQIQFLLDTVPCIENGDFKKKIMVMNTAVMNINSLLRRRTELKMR